MGASGIQILGEGLIVSREFSVQDLLFAVEEVPVEAVARRNGTERRITLPGKKALLHAATGAVLGVVSRQYRVVTNQEAVGIAQDVCAQAFPGIAPMEWEPTRAAAPRTLSYSFIDLTHRTHVLNYMDVGGSASDPFTPFLRVTNSFNGARALRFDIGFLRQHCSNGMIFEEEVATVTAAHNKEALQKMKLEIKTVSLDQLWRDFSDFIASVRSVSMSGPQSDMALNAVLRVPQCNEGDTSARRTAVATLHEDIGVRLGNYRQALGENAYAVFNALTDIAARPPENPYFQKDRDTLEKRAGRWLKHLAQEQKSGTLNIDQFTADWRN